MIISEEMYKTLFNAMTDALEKLTEVEEILKNAQISAEEKYISK